MHIRITQMETSFTYGPRSKLLLLGLLQPPDGRSDRCTSSGGIIPCASSNLHPAVLHLALPDADAVALHGVLTTECAGVLAMLRNFHLLDSLPQRGTIPGTIFTGDSDLLGTLGHCDFSCRSESSKFSLVVGAGVLAML